jgi:hypothetical protein
MRRDQGGDNIIQARTFGFRPDLSTSA